MKYVVGFGKFWYDFIIGDSGVLAVGGAAPIVGAAGWNAGEASEDCGTGRK